MKTIKSLFAALMAIAIASSVFAQVSPRSPAPASASLITIEGRITKVEIANFHVSIYVDAMVSDNNNLVAWVIETGSLNELSAKGMKLGDLKVGRLIRARGTSGSGRNRLEAPVSEISFPQ